MKYTTEEILNCLKIRKQWYQDAWDIVFNRQPHRPFDFPEGDTANWEGAIKELQNTIDMMEAK